MAEHTDEPPYITEDDLRAAVALGDQTIRRCIGFAKRERAGGIVVVNNTSNPATQEPRNHGTTR